MKWYPSNGYDYIYVYISHNGMTGREKSQFGHYMGMERRNGIGGIFIHDGLNYNESRGIENRGWVEKINSIKS